MSVKQEQENTKILLQRLWRNIEPTRRVQFVWLLLLMILVSFAEILSIGSVFPFLSVLTAPEVIYESPRLNPYFIFFGISDAKQLLLPFTIIFVMATLISGIMRLLMLWLSVKLSFVTGADISKKIYRNTLYQPYLVHCTRNSSEVINGITNKSNTVIYSTIAPLLSLIGALMILSFILVSLIYFQPLISVTAFIGFGTIYAGIIFVTRKQIAADSFLIARESTQIIKSLREGLGGIRDVLLDGTQEIYCRIYQSSDDRLRRAQGNSLFIISSPRYAMEALGMALIAGIAYFLTQNVSGSYTAVPVLGALALGAQRMLPLMQQVYGSWVQINSGKSSLQDVLNLLEQSLPEYAVNSRVVPIEFNRTIELKDISFRYHDQAPIVLNRINLTIPKGSRIGIIGGSGVGKSTLLDVIMGLLLPADGSLVVDGQEVTPLNQRAWQLHIAHVPQSIFLADSTIAENIALGNPVNDIEHDRVFWAAEQAQLASSINSWPLKYQTIVGEGGIRLSGGQRQRIGIARALYKNADVIIFDEATSALDNKTESAVIDAVEGLGKDLTLLIIAHRLTTLKHCSMIIELEASGIKRVGSYEEIIGIEK